MRNLLEIFNVQVSSVSLRYANSVGQQSSSPSVSLSFDATLLLPPDQQISALSDFRSFFSLALFLFGGYQVQDRNRGATGITSACKKCCLELFYHLDIEGMLNFQMPFFVYSLLSVYNDVPRGGRLGNVISFPPTLLWCSIQSLYLLYLRKQLSSNNR